LLTSQERLCSTELVWDIDIAHRSLLPTQTTEKQVCPFYADVLQADAVLPGEQQFFPDIILQKLSSITVIIRSQIVDFAGESRHK
jgi:hypothetical protein